MERPEQILIIILSVTLSFFLLVAIIVLIKVIQILNHLKHITEQAQKFADNAESISEIFKHSAAPVAIGKLLASISQAVFNRGKKAKEKE